MRFTCNRSTIGHTPPKQCQDTKQCYCRVNCSHGFLRDLSAVMTAWPKAQLCHPAHASQDELVELVQLIRGMLRSVIVISVGC